MGRSFFSLPVLFFTLILFFNFPVLKAALSTQAGSSSILMAQNLMLSGFENNSSAIQATHPAILSKISQAQSSIYFFSTQADFKKTPNIVIQNNATSGTNQKIADYDPNPPDQLMFAYHYGTPISDQWWLKSMGLSLIAPLPQLVILDTTSSFLPKYYWYDSRFNKTEILLNTAQKISPKLNSSFSIYGQWDLIAQSEVTTGTQGGSPSSARIQGKLRPRFYPLISFLWMEDKYLIELSWSAKSKQKIKNSVTGIAPLGGTTTVDYSFIMDSNSNVEPMRLKADFTYKLNTHFNLLTGLTFEDWSNLNDTSLLITDSQGIVTNSANYENISGKKIFSPALGFEYLKESSQWSMSYRYLPKVFEKDNSSSGNTIDQNKHIWGIGLKQTSVLWGQRFTWSIASQIHYIPAQKIEKYDTQEDGSNGLKIGASSYNTGGYYTLVSLGLEQTF